MGTLLRHHVPEIAAMDLFVVPTFGFNLLYVFIIIRLDRRDLVWINVTPNSTAEWIARLADQDCARLVKNSGCYFRLCCT
jgi:hypothetical protein